MDTLSADTTIEDTTGTRIDTGDIITTMGTAGKQEHTSCGTAEAGWNLWRGAAVERTRGGSLAGGGSMTLPRHGDPLCH